MPKYPLASMGRISAASAIGNAPAGLAPALTWFHEMTGHTVAWPDPSPVPGVDRLACRPKGIYKPKGFDVALSVRESLDGPYDDTRVVVDALGAWRYDYFQEGLTPADRDREYTNVALMENIRTRTPVGVLIQSKGRPEPRYLVRGLAMVVAWRDGFFELRGFGAQGEIEL
jgi:putative restriction endonuclease